MSSHTEMEGDLIGIISLDRDGDALPRREVRRNPHTLYVKKIARNAPWERGISHSWSAISDDEEACEVYIFYSSTRDWLEVGVRAAPYNYDYTMWFSGRVPEDCCTADDLFDLANVSDNDIPF